MVPLTDDGLSVTAEPKKVYDGWQYPEDWAVETFALESPKMLKHGDYYYMVVAEGGTAGPPTSHMVGRRALEDDRGPVGEHAGQPADPHRVGQRTLVVERARDDLRRPGRPVVRGVSRLRERLLDPRAARRFSSRSSGPPTAG